MMNSDLNISLMKTIMAIRVPFVLSALNTIGYAIELGTCLVVSVVMDMTESILTETVTLGLANTTIMIERNAWQINNHKSLMENVNGFR